MRARVSVAKAELAEQIQIEARKTGRLLIIFDRKSTGCRCSDVEKPPTKKIGSGQEKASQTAIDIIRSDGAANLLR
jgi:hypothetical protein